MKLNGLLDVLGGGQGLLGMIAGGGLANAPERVVGLLQNPLGIPDEFDQPNIAMQQFGQPFGGLPLGLLYQLLRDKNKKRKQPGAI